MKIGDRVEIKVTGEQGVLIDVRKYDSSFSIRFDSGEEVLVSRLEIRGLQNKEKKKKELMRKVRKGDGSHEESETVGVSDVKR